MSPLVIGFIWLAVAFVLMFLRVPIAFAFATAAFFGLLSIRGVDPALSGLGRIAYATLSTYTWTVIPLFIFMGYLAQQTNVAEEFYDGIRRWIGHLRGGLASAIILGDTAFGACSGDSISAAVTFSAISLPEMRKYKYDDKLTLGSIAAGSLLAQLIPPSIGFIVYGGLTEVSIGRLFLAGLFPGLLLAALYILVIYIQCRRNPALGPPGPQTTWRQKLGAAPGMWTLIVVFVIIIGGLYAGLFSPTEAGAFGAFVVLIIGLGRRRLRWQGFKTAMVDTGLTSGMIFFLLIGCLLFNLFLAVTGLPGTIAHFVGSATTSPTGTLLIIVAIYFVLGMFMDALAMILLTVPIFFPIVVGLGVSPIHFGVVVVAMLAIGAVSPPFGIIVYAMSGMIKDVPLFSIFRGVAPFLVAMMTLVVLVVLFPSISTFLPSIAFD